MAQILTFPQKQIDLQYRIARVCKVIHQDQLQVCTDDQEYLQVQLSADCLLMPALGDKVVVLCSRDQGYLMHVLEQAQPEIKIFNVRAKFKIEVPEFELVVTKQACFRFSQVVTFQARKLVAKIPFLEASGRQWMSALKRSWFKSDETVQDLGHCVLDTQSMHESHASLKILKTPLLVEKTDVHHVCTDKFLVD